MCLNSKVSWILSYVENFFNVICDFLPMGALLMHILHGKKIKQPIEKLSESFWDLSLNWAAVGELKKRCLYTGELWVKIEWTIRLKSW